MVCGYRLIFGFVAEMDGTVILIKQIQSTQYIFTPSISGWFCTSPSRSLRAISWSTRVVSLP